MYGLLRAPNFYHPTKRAAPFEILDSAKSASRGRIAEYIQRRPESKSDFPFSLSVVLI